MCALAGGADGTYETQGVLSTKALACSSIRMSHVFSSAEVLQAFLTPIIIHTDTNPNLKPHSVTGWLNIVGFICGFLDIFFPTDYSFLDKPFPTPF
eukprot:m.197432 g.197432  ORF g.197432 m.197432 type:complete len:96 (+) comp14911_c0_seq18:2109-2396(+)